MKHCGVVAVLIILCGLAIFPQLPHTVVSAETGKSQETTAPNLTAGTSVKYHIKRNQKMDAGFKTVYESDLKISVISENKKKEEHSYLVELVANENTADVRIIQFSVTPEGKPIMNKLVIKQSDFSPVEINLTTWAEKAGLSVTELFQELTGNLLIIPLVPPETAGKQEKVKIKIKDKEELIPCRCYLQENTDAKEQNTSKLWYAGSEGAESENGNTIPFPGLVKMLIFSADGGQAQIMLTEYNTQGAVSLIKDRPLRPDFKETK